MDNKIIETLKPVVKLEYCFPIPEEKRNAYTSPYRTRPGQEQNKLYTEEEIDNLGFRDIFYDHQTDISLDDEELNTLKENLKIFHGRMRDEVMKCPEEISALYEKAKPLGEWLRYRYSYTYINKDGFDVRMSCTFNHPITKNEFVEKLNEFVKRKEYSIKALCSEKINDILTFIDKINHETHLRNHGIMIGENAIKLDNGKYLVNDFGKYSSSISFVIAERNIDEYEYRYNPVLKSSTNIFWDGDPKYMFGRYWKSKRGTTCFEPLPEEKSTHILIKVKWGGPFNHTGGRNTITNTLYHKRASSNGGGAGNTYYIVEKGRLCNTMSEDDI
jgi:hypothetical protein